MNDQLYTRIDAQTALGGATYPFVAGIPDWHFDLFEMTPEGVAGTLEHDATLRWVRNDGASDLVIPGVTTEEFFRRTGLRINTAKGLFTVAKRLSRLMRPYFVWAFFKPGQIEVIYSGDKQLWDGAGLVSRRFLERMTHRLGHLPENKRREMRRELLHGERFELTLQGEHGQDKAHVLVVEKLPNDADFQLPPDTKGDVTLEGRVFVGLNPVHGKSMLRIDGQSLINLNPFFTPEQLAAWMREAGDVLLAAIEHGDVERLVGAIDGLDDDDLQALGQWATREYLVSGGHPMWFSWIVRSLANQHIKALESANEKVRFPIPGARRYLFCDVVGGLTLAPGTCHITGTTLFVSRDDYARFVEVTGGADQDDSYLIHCFIDFDGLRKALVWRNPNQAGEWLLLQPDASSELPTWETTAGAADLPQHDSRVLTPRIDTRTQTYTGVVRSNPALDDLKGQPYSLALCTPYLMTALANKGALGAYCNVLMVTQAIWGKMPATLPDVLSKVIDSTVKTGDDVSAVLEWCEYAATRMMESGTQVPRALAARVNGFVREAYPEGFPATSDHWFDKVIELAARHVVEFGAKRDALALKAVPPAEVLEAGKPFMAEGARIRSAYHASFNRADPEVNGFEAARRMTEPMFAQWCGAHLKNIVLGTLAQCYLHRDGNPKADAVLWQMGAKTDGVRQPGIAQLTLRVLREVALIGEPIISEDGFVLFYQPEFKPTSTTLIGLNGVWFNLMPNRPARMDQVSKTVRDQQKAHIAALANGQLAGKRLTIRMQGERKLAYDGSTLFAYISKETAANVTADTLTIVSAIEDDGNLVAVATCA